MIEASDETNVGIVLEALVLKTTDESPNGSVGSDQVVQASTRNELVVQTRNGLKALFVTWNFSQRLQPAAHRTERGRS